MCLTALLKVNAIILVMDKKPPQVAIEKKKFIKLAQEIQKIVANEKTKQQSDPQHAK